MNIEKHLKKSGITTIAELDSDSIKAIAEYASNRICTIFTKLHFNYDDLFHEICSMPMFIADLPIGIADANYFYMNSAIYFRDGMGLLDLKKYAIHEIIHHLQKIQDEKNNLLRIGLCNLKSGRACGMALNEAAVQIVTSYILENKLETVNYYEIEFSTISPNLYPLICNLLSQMCYIVGEDLLYDSVFNSNDNFEKKFKELCGKSAFNKIKRNFDLLLDTEEKIVIFNSKFEDANCPQNKASKYKKIINTYKNKIKEIFFETQKIIFTSFFNNQFFKLQSESDINIYKTKFTIYKELIGITDSYSEFSDYYSKKMHDIEIMYEHIISHKFPAKKNNNFIIFIRSIFNRLHM